MAYIYNFNRHIASTKNKTYNNWQSRGQHDSSYYQPQPTTCNQRQQYHHYRITQQAPFINDYDKGKVVKHGNINIGIPTLDKKYPLFHWEMILMQERKTQLILLRPP